MTMEVLAAEFPDIYQQFLDPQPSPISREMSQAWDEAGEEDRSMVSDMIVAADETSLTVVVRDSNKNMKYKAVPKVQYNSYASLTQIPTHSSSIGSNQRITSSTDNPRSVTALGDDVMTTSIQSPNMSTDSTNSTVPNDFPPEFADLDDILATLSLLDNTQQSTNNNIQLDLVKSAYGCNWSKSSQQCLHGNSCPFTTQLLGLADFQEPQNVLTPPPRVHSVVVLRQTPNGLVKLQESLVPLGQEEVIRLQSMTPQEQVRHLGLNTAQLRQGGQLQAGTMTSTASTLQLRDQPGQYAMSDNVPQYTNPPCSISASNGHFVNPTNNYQAQFSNIPNSQSNVTFRSSAPVIYRPPPNAVLVKVPTSVLQNQPPQPYTFSIPTPSPSPPTPSVTSLGTSPTGECSLFCSKCDSQFHDNKSLVKHTRNQHQVYSCNKCGEQTVGYYRMASHTKKNHSKEPAFFCPCGRNFSEKRGMTKHGNSCSFYKN